MSDGSVQRTLEKEAAEAGVSLDEYIRTAKLPRFIKAAHHYAKKRGVSIDEILGDVRERAENPKLKFTTIVITPCDQGQHGISSCGACGHVLDEHKKSDQHFCPKCLTGFNGTSVGSSFGGSDF